MIFLVYWIINWKSVKPTKEIAWRSPNFWWTRFWIIVLIILLGRFLFSTTGIQIFKPTNQFSIVEVVGIILTVIGLIIAIVARRTLGDNWSSDIELKKEHELITRGIYQYVRHPIYTGLLFMGVGSIMALQTIWHTIFFIFMFGFLYFKMKKEETLMLKHFHKEYEAYMKKTKALIPFIY